MKDLLRGTHAHSYTVRDVQRRVQGSESKPMGWVLESMESFL